MLLRKIMLLLISSALVFCIWNYYDSDALETNQELLYANVDLNNNTPAYLSGCKTFHKPVVARKTIYPTIRKNFVTRLCALEVFPSNDVIAKMNANSNQEVVSGIY